MPVDVCQGENFPQEPKKHENKKHKKMGIDIVGLTQLQKPPENQKNKKQTNSFDPWRGSEEKLDR